MIKPATAYNKRLHPTLLRYASRRDGAVRAWKGYPWESLNRLHEKGMIDNPRSKTKSVILTEEGERRSKELF